MSIGPGPRAASEDLDSEQVKLAYSRWAGVYDLVFGPIFRRARRRAARILDPRPGERILEVGVGTGLSLKHLPRHCRVVGVDLSRPMLQRALARLPLREGPQVALVEADGGRLPFPDATFDGALAPYVLSAAPDPVAVLREMERTCRPGTRMVILNHFSSSRPWLAGIEGLLSPLTSRMLGFRTYFPLPPLLAAADLQVERLERVPPLRYWHVVCCRVRKKE